MNANFFGLSLAYSVFLFNFNDFKTVNFNKITFIICKQFKILTNKISRLRLGDSRNILYLYSILIIYNLALRLSVNSLSICPILVFSHPFLKCLYFLYGITNSTVSFYLIMSNYYITSLFQSSNMQSP